MFKVRAFARIPWFHFVCRVMADDAAVGITTRVCVSGGALGSIPWVISEMENANGVQYVKLSKVDTGFERFVYGGYRQKENSLKDAGWLEQLREQRNAAQTLSLIHI